MAILITNIRELVNVRTNWPVLRGKNLSVLPIITNAYLIIEGEQIASFGEMNDLAYAPDQFTDHYDARGGTVLPSWCDSHTHLVFAGSREAEFVDKINGLSYTEIAARGGGILASAEKLNAISEDELFIQSYKRLQEVIRSGTGAIEIKSGYGLTTEGELKILRVIRRLKQHSKIPIRVTFLGAHAFPAMYKQDKDGYINLLTNEMLPQIAAEGLADYIDVFCEEGFFSPEQMARICTAGKTYGLQPKLHVNQLNSIGGLQQAIALHALSADHLEAMTNEDVQSLANANTIGTLLPTAAFFLRMTYPPARQLVDAGCAIAVASDYNPGSSPSGNMNFVVALSCIQMRLLPEEAINTATINGAHAMGLQDEVGTISVGKKANLIITTPVPSLNYIPYAFGTNLIDRVMLCGEWVG